MLDMMGYQMTDIDFFSIDQPHMELTPVFLKVMLSYGSMDNIALESRIILAEVNSLYIGD